MNYRISELRIEGYRTLKSLAWRPGALNVVIGPNASGKSNLLKALSMISASADGGLEDFIDRDGGMASVLWNRAASKIAFSLAFAPESAANDSLDIVYDAELTRLGKTASYRLSSEELAFWKRHMGDRPRLRERTIFHSGLSSVSPGENLYTGRFQPQQRNVSMELAGKWASETDLARFMVLNASSSSSLSPQVAAAIEMLKLVPTDDDMIQINAVGSSLQSWRVLDDLSFGRSSKARQSTTARFDLQLDSDGANLASVMHSLYTSNSEFREEMFDAMYAAFGDEFVDIVFPPTGGQSQIQMAIKWRSIKDPVPTSDLSDGTLRFISIIAALTDPSSPALIAIDEPETGLHPRVMRIIAEYAQSAAPRSQVIFTTHSAAFLDAFDRDAPPATTVIELKSGSTTMRSVDSQELRRWLEDYSLGNLYSSNELEAMGNER